MNRGLFLSCVGDATRFELLQQLAQRDACVNDLVEATGQSQSNISHHLKQLRECGFVVFERDGKSNRYSLAAPQLAQFIDAVDATVEALESSCNCEVCC